MHPKIHAILSASPILYTEHRHADLPTPIRNPQDFAQALGYPLSYITKSVVFSSEPDKTYSLAVCSVDRKINLKLLAELVHAKRVHMASAEELQSITDYPSRGVSPLGVQGISIFVDEELLSLPTILIGGGEIGNEIELNPKDMVSLAQATVVPLTRSSTLA